MNDLDVKEIRLNLGVSQEKLAEMLGVDIRTVQHWENGRVISDRNSVKIRKLLQQKSEETPQKSEEKNSESKEITLLEQQIKDKDKVITLLEQQIKDKEKIIKLLEEKTAMAGTRPDVPISPFACADVKK